MVEVAAVTQAAVADSTVVAALTAEFTVADSRAEKAVDITAESAPAHLLGADRPAVCAARLQVRAVRAPDARGLGKDTAPAIRLQDGINSHPAAATPPAAGAERWRHARVRLP